LDRRKKQIKIDTKKEFMLFFLTALWKKKITNYIYWKKNVFSLPKRIIQPTLFGNPVQFSLNN